MLGFVYVYELHLPCVVISHLLTSSPPTSHGNAWQQRLGCRPFQPSSGQIRNQWPIWPEWPTNWPALADRRANPEQHSRDFRATFLELAEWRSGLRLLQTTPEAAPPRCTQFVPDASALDPLELRRHLLREPRVCLCAWAGGSTHGHAPGGSIGPVCDASKSLGDRAPTQLWSNLQQARRLHLAARAVRRQALWPVGVRACGCTTCCSSRQYMFGMA